MNKIITNLKDKKRIPAIVSFAYGVISIFFLFIPYVYTINREWAEPINGFSAFVFMEDESQFFLHYGVVCIAISLVMSVLLAICSLVSFLSDEEHYFRYYCASSFLLFLKSVVDLVALIFIIKCKSTVNIYPNLGMYVSLIGSILVLGVSAFFLVRTLNNRKAQKK